MRTTFSTYVLFKAMLTVHRPAEFHHSHPYNVTKAYLFLSDGLVDCWLIVAVLSAVSECKILGDTGTNV
jgi:hypothetical protein